MTDQQPHENQPTTTHAEWGAGDPRLRVTRADERSVHHITTDEVRIGSAEGNELRLADTDPVHATITHDKRDEYVLTLHGEGGMNASPVSAESGGGERSEILRTGAQFTAGEWMLVFSRDEFADHGRPFGGREGGELDDQAAQPARPDYSDDARDEQPNAEREVKDG